MLRKTIMLSVSILLAVCVGCQSHVQNKKAAKERWDKASAQIKLALAQQQYDNGKYEEATKAIQECISADPEDPVSRVLYGKLLLASGRCSEAKEQLSFALKSEEKLHDGWYWLGVAEQESRNYPKAYECYNKALLLEPAKVDYILAVADAQVALGNCQGALKLLSEKEAVLPSEVSLKVAAADLMFRRGDTEEAIKLYEEAALLAEDSGIAESLGYSYILDKRWERAAEVFEGLVAQCKDQEKSKLLLRQLAVCNMNAKRYDKALSCYSKLVVEERENARTLSISTILPDASDALTILTNIGLNTFGYEASAFEKFSPPLTASATSIIIILNVPCSDCSEIASSASLRTTPLSSITDSCVVNIISSADLTFVVWTTPLTCPVEFAWLRILFPLTPAVSLVRAPCKRVSTLPPWAEADVSSSFTKSTSFVFLVPNVPIYLYLVLTIVIYITFYASACVVRSTSSIDTIPAFTFSIPSD